MRHLYGIIGTCKLHREGPNLGKKHRVPCLLLPSGLDAQFGTPYPRSAGFDTDTRHKAEPSTPVGLGPLGGEVDRLCCGCRPRRGRPRRGQRAWSLRCRENRGSSPCSTGGSYDAGTRSTKTFEAEAMQVRSGRGAGLQDGGSGPKRAWTATGHARRQGRRGT